ncbi:MAG: hypothetical protein K2P81_17195 [Bacteriovoracaceae bacterium]|nr:hypothetical protein [Bacteriovoracaceae bacterium]
MILTLFLVLSSFAQTDVLLGQYFHARAEAELVKYLEERGTSVQEAVENGEKTTCRSVDDFKETLDAITKNAQLTLADFKKEGVLWRKPSTYGEESIKILLEPPRATQYALERLRFSRLEAFGRLSKLAPGCLDIFRKEPTGSKNNQMLPRLRLESLNNVTPALFCSTVVRYWRELESNINPGCKKSSED